MYIAIGIMLAEHPLHVILNDYISIFKWQW